MFSTVGLALVAEHSAGGERMFNAFAAVIDEALQTTDTALKRVEDICSAQ